MSFPPFLSSMYFCAIKHNIDRILKLESHPSTILDYYLAIKSGIFLFFQGNYSITLNKLLILKFISFFGSFYQINIFVCTACYLQSFGRIGNCSCQTDEICLGQKKVKRNIKRETSCCWPP